MRNLKFGSEPKQTLPESLNQGPYIAQVPLESSWRGSRATWVVIAMRVLVVSQWFPPEPRELYLELAQAYQKAGHEVQAVTGFPNWPGGKIYPGYKQRIVQKEVIGDIPTVRLPLYANHDSGGVKRVLNLVSLSISLFLLGPFVLKRADRIHVVQLPFLVFAAKWLAFWWRAQVVMEIQDLWPETFSATGTITSSKILGAIDKLCHAAYRACRRIRVISPGFRQALIDRGVPSEKIAVIPNWIDDEVHRPGLGTNQNEAPVLPAGFRVLYAGSIGIPQALSVVLDAAARLKDHPEIVFLLAGDGVEKEPLEQAAKERGLDRVKFLGRFPQDQMGGLYEQADALLVHLSPDPLFAITIPSKVVSYLAYQKPILAAIEGDTRAMIERTGAGISVTPGDANALADATLRLFQMSPAEREEMGRAGRNAAESEFSFRQAIPKLAQFIKGDS